jgi:hypothetical protein
MDKIIKYLRLLEQLNKQSLDFVAMLKEQLLHQYIIIQIQFCFILFIIFTFLILCFFDELFFLIDKIKTKIWKSQEK